MQGWPLGATLFGIFIDDLHHHLQTTCPNAGVDIGALRLSDLVYADDICLIASSPVHLHYDIWKFLDAAQSCLAFF